MTRRTHCTSSLHYLLVTKGLWALDLALTVILHNHHGRVDFSHCEVCRCWESDKLTCKIRPFWNGPWAQGMVGQGCGACARDKKRHRNTEQTVFSQADFLCLEVNKATLQLFNANNAFLSAFMAFSKCFHSSKEICDWPWSEKTSIECRSIVRNPLSVLEHVVGLFLCFCNVCCAHMWSERVCVGVSVQYQRVAAVRDGLSEAILRRSEEKQRWSTRSLRPRPPRLGRACTLQLTLVWRHQQIQMLLGEIGPDGHHLFP